MAKNIVFLYVRFILKLAQIDVLLSSISFVKEILLCIIILHIISCIGKTQRTL